MSEREGDARGGGVWWRQRTESHLFDQSTTPGRWRVSVAIVTLVAVAACWHLLGPPGLAVAAVTVGVWYVLGAPYGVAVGAVQLAAMAPETHVMLFLATALFLLLVISPLFVRSASQGDRLLALVATVAGVGAGLAIADLVSLWVAVPVVLLGFGLASYGLYRYHLLTLGLLTPS